MIKKKTFINELKQGDRVEDVFVILKARQGTAKNGEPYWDVEFQDKTGRIPGKIWYPHSSRYSNIPSEELAYVKGYVDSFRDNLQIVISELKVIEERIDAWSDFLPTVSTPPEELLSELESLFLKELQYRPWRKLCGLIFRDGYVRKNLLICPAAKSIHHAYIGGLLEHTLNVCKICLQVCEIFKDLDREILVVASALHDLGKIKEFTGKVFIDYSDKGQLLGHIILGLEMIAPFLDRVKDLEEKLVLHLKHLILSHHGEYEFGSPKRPKTREAFVLHFADNLDAKLNTVANLLEGMEGEEDNWSKYQRSLDRKIFRPVSTMELLGEKKKDLRRHVKQCLLPLKG